MKKTFTLKQQKKLTIKNLKKVLRELPKLAKKIPEIKMDFNMKILGVYNYCKINELHKCLTSGCLLGNSARIFEAEFTDDLFTCFQNTFNYKSFGIKYYPYLYDIYGNENIRWKYLFSLRWAKPRFVDLNTLYFDDLNSALQRIENLLENDLECNEFDYKTNKIIN